MIGLSGLGRRQAKNAIFAWPFAWSAPQPVASLRRPCGTTRFLNRAAGWAWPAGRRQRVYLIVADYASRVNRLGVEKKDYYHRKLNFFWQALWE
jgi:hypothetical protein